MKLLINGKSHKINTIEMSSKGIKFKINDIITISDIENGFYILDGLILYFAQYSTIDIKGSTYTMMFSKFDSIEL